MSLEHDSSTSPDRILTVALKLTPFWLSDPQLWFAQVEAQFQLAVFTPRGLSSTRDRVTLTWKCLSGARLNFFSSFITPIRWTAQTVSWYNDLTIRASPSADVIGYHARLWGTYSHASLEEDAAVTRRSGWRYGWPVVSWIISSAPLSTYGWIRLCYCLSALSLDELAERADRMTEAGSHLLFNCVHSGISQWDSRLWNQSPQADMADLKRLFQTFTISSPRSNTSGKRKEASKTENSEP